MPAPTKKITWLAIALMLPLTYAQDKPVSVKDLDLSIDPSDIEPSVTIKKHENRVEEEYSVNNNVYMIKITPNSGPPYYLVDPDGSGSYEMRRHSAGMDIQVPQWSLISW